MDRVQAQTILLGLGDPTTEERRAGAVGVVLDMLLDEGPEGGAVEQAKRRQGAAEARGVRHAEQAEENEQQTRRAVEAHAALRNRVRLALGRHIDRTAPDDDTAVVEAVGRLVTAVYRAFPMTPVSSDPADTDATLLANLRTLGDAYGPLGVALAAASLTDAQALIARLQSSGAAPEPEEG